MGPGPEESSLDEGGPVERSRPRSWWRRRSLLFGLAAIAIVITVIVLVVSDPPSPPKKGTPLSGDAPAFVLEDLRDSDRRVSLADFRGRPVVVNFFAAWCAPCRREMPAFQSVYEELKGRVDFIGIDNEDIRSDGLALMRETEVTYGVGFDPQGQVARDFGILGMPTTVFVSAAGKQLERVTGEMTEQRLRATIERLFRATAD